MVGTKRREMTIVVSTSKPAFQMKMKLMPAAPKHPERTSSLFERPYPRTTVVTHPPQVMGAPGVGGPNNPIPPRTPSPERQKKFWEDEKAAGRGPKSPTDPAGGVSPNTPSLFVAAYPRTTVRTGKSQVMGAEGDQEIRPRTPPAERLARFNAKQVAAADGNGNGDNEGAGNNSGNEDGSNKQPEEPKKSIFYPIQTMQPKPTKTPRVMNDGLGPVPPRTPPQERSRLWAEEQARNAAAAGRSGSTSDSEPNPPPVDTPPGDIVEPNYPVQPEPTTRPQVSGADDRQDVRPSTPPHIREQRRLDAAAAERAAAEAEAEATKKTPEASPEASDEPTGGKGKAPKAPTDEGTPPDPEEEKKKAKEFSKLFAPPAPRRHLGPDGRLPANIANAPVLGDTPPPRETRLQRKRRIAAEMEAMKQELRSQGGDPDAVLAATEGTPDLTAFPLVRFPFIKRGYLGTS